MKSRAYRLRLTLDLPERHTIEYAIEAGTDREALDSIHEHWRSAPIWEHDSHAELVTSRGEIIWRQDQPHRSG